MYWPTNPSLQEKDNHRSRDHRFRLEAHKERRKA